MGVGVVAKLFSGVVQLLHRFGVALHPVAHQEEGGVDARLVQNGNQLLRILVAPGRVKGQGNLLLLTFDVVDRQFPLRRRRAHRLRVADYPKHGRRNHQAAQRGPTSPFQYINLHHSFPSFQCFC